MFSLEIMNMLIKMLELVTGVRYCAPPRGAVDELVLGGLGNSSTASGVATPRSGSYLLGCNFSVFRLSVSMRKYWGQHSCLSSTFYTAILNGTLFFRSAGIDLVFVVQFYI